MAVRRLNDTAALTGRASPGDSHSVSVCEIDNGYIVEECSYDSKTGAYKTSRQFTPEAPRVMAPRIARSARSDAAGSMGLEAAVRSIDRK